MLEFTQGKSPHPKLSLGPPLPVGIEAFCEPIDLWIEKKNKSFSVKDIICRLNSFLPSGFRFVPDLGFLGNLKPLSESVNGAFYVIKFERDTLCNRAYDLIINNFDLEFEVSGRIRRFLIYNVKKISYNKLILISGDPFRNSIGAFIEYLVLNKIIEGWEDLEIKRLIVGSILKNNRFKLCISLPKE